MKRFIHCLIALAVIGTGCSSESGDSADFIDPSVDVGLASICGTAVDGGSIENPPPEDKTVAVDIDPIRSDVLAVTFAEGPELGGTILVKLHGVTADGVSENRNQRGMDIIRSQYPTGFLVPAGEGCTATAVGGGQATLAQVYSEFGENLTEALIAAGAVVPSPGEACNAGELAACYAGISVPEEISDDVVFDFLWKPESERSGDLVVLVNPFAATVVVNGTTLSDTGPSNGRGTTARANQPGCAFGQNVRVEFFDSQGRRILTADGRREVIVPNGCARFEFVL